MSLLKSASTVAFFTICSRILGYPRDVLMASILGAGPLADAFLVAFRLPNFFRTISAEGAFNSAFIPLFSIKLEEKGKEEAVNFASHVLSFMFVILLALTMLMQIFMPAVMYVLAPGFSDDPEKFDATVHFGRILFPYLLFISMTSLFSGILNVFGKFAVAALAPMWLNICSIFALAVVARYTNAPAEALVWAVMLSGVIQFLWVAIAAYKNGARVYLSLPKLDDDVKILLKRMVPGIIGSGATQINVWINTVMATQIAGAVSYLYYADRLAQFPLAIIGTAIGTALLPMLSRQIKAKKCDEAIQTQSSALIMAMILTIPAAVALLVLAYPLISLMFERGAFTSKDAQATAAALMAYSVGLPAFVMVKIFAPVFFANSDTKTPVKIAIVCLVANICISLVLVNYIGHVGLAVGTSFSAWLNASLLCTVLVKRQLFKFGKELIIRLLKILLSAVIMGVMLWYLQNMLAVYLSGELLIKVLAFSVLIISGVFVFFTTAHVTRCVRIGDFKRILRGK